MWARERRGGFTLLELEISVIILGLGVLGLGKLIVSQERMITVLEQRYADDPLLYITPSEDHIERLLGLPAGLVRDEPFPLESKSEASSDPTPYQVTVLSVETAVGSLIKSAEVLVEEAPEEGANP